jgi:hypothetical protein
MLSVTLLRAEAEYVEPANPGGSSQCHSHDRPTRNQDASDVFRVLPVTGGWHEPVSGLAANHCDWPR